MFQCILNWSTPMPLAINGRSEPSPNWSTTQSPRRPKRHLHPHQPNQGLSQQGPRIAGCIQWQRNESQWPQPIHHLPYNRRHGLRRIHARAITEWFEGDHHAVRSRRRGLHRLPFMLNRQCRATLLYICSAHRPGRHHCPHSQLQSHERDIWQADSAMDAEREQ